MHTILVVEDDGLNQDLISEQVEDLGNVEVAHNGADALNQVRATTPDVILLDLNMPVMNGFQFIEQLRGGDNQTPIVVITAMDLRKADYTFLQSHNISRVFEKGRYSFDELFSSVRTALQGT